MSANELNSFLQSFQRPAEISDAAWTQLLSQSRQVWSSYLAGENWNQTLEITCKESYLMLVNQNGQLIVSDDSLLNYVKTEQVLGWMKRLEEIALKAIRDKKYEIAERYFGKMLKLDASDYMAHYRRAIVRMRLLNHKGALEDLSQAILLKSDFAVLYTKRAEVFRLLDIDHKAMTDLNRSIQLDPTNAPVYELRGKFRLSLGDRAGGRLDILRAEELRSRGYNGNSELSGKAA
jgi:tetratricopeptide (TPR) repeat protein